MMSPIIAFLGGSIGGWELLVVAVVVLVLFGPKRIPEIAKTIGKVTAQLRGAAQDFRDQISKAAEEPPPAPGSLPDAAKGPAKEPEKTAGEGAADPSACEAGLSDRSAKGGEPHGRAG